MSLPFESMITKSVLRFYSDVTAIYLFGSFVNNEQRPESDIDIALLLPFEIAKREKVLALSPCRFALEKDLKREIDLVNIRFVTTVFQKEIIATGRVIYCADYEEMWEFESLVISFYQKLNEERREIIEDFYNTGRA